MVHSADPKAVMPVLKMKPVKAKTHKLVRTLFIAMILHDQLSLKHPLRDENPFPAHLANP